MIILQIKKIDSNCITCRISKAELDSMGVHIEDLMTNRDKTKELVDNVLTEARNTLDFSTAAGQINVQLSVLSDGDISLTIFNDEKSALSAMIKQYKDLIENSESAAKARQSSAQPIPEVSDPKNSRHANTGNDTQQNSHAITSLTSDQVKEKLDSLKDKDPVDFPAEVSFDNITDAIRMCRIISKWNPDSESAFYKMNDRYYLSFTLTDKKKTLARSVFAIAEYCGKVENGPSGLSPAFLSEHGITLIEEDAVAKLGAL